MASYPRSQCSHGQCGQYWYNPIIAQITYLVGRSMNSDVTKPPVITIDGSSGSGKGTISLLVANRLGWHYLDSGALYRVLAYFSQQEGVNLANIVEESTAQQLVELAHQLPVEFRQVHPEQPAEIYLAGILVDKQIRTESAGFAASKIAVLPAVRTALLARQRAFLLAPGLVADGRDMGTVVFPEAKLKVFLQANAEERALRRYNQLKAMGLDGNLQDLIGEIARRDEQDRNRAIAPMKPAADAVIIDTTSLDIKAVFNKVMDLVRERQIGV